MTIEFEMKLVQEVEGTLSEMNFFSKRSEQGFGKFSEYDFGKILMHHVACELNISDEANCTWYTDADRISYYGKREWIVSRKKSIAILIDAANVLIHGCPMDLDAAYKRNQIIG